VRIVPSAYHEMPERDLAPRELALRHARGKAAGAAPSTDLIVAADTVVDVDGEVLSTSVRFADIKEETLAAYVASGDGDDKAGAYGIQGFAATLVERIDGDYFTVVGFPLAAFAAALPRIGYHLHPPAAQPTHSEVHA